MNKSGRERLIFALDIGKDLNEALTWIELLKDHVGMFKVGKEAFTRFGPRIVSEIHKQGGKVFLDLKFHDIPNTVAKAAEAAVELNVAMFNIHASGGQQMMKSAVEAAEAKARSMGIPVPIILAVTVLTSLNDADVKDIGFAYPTKELVPKLASLARNAGITGVVASAQDVLKIQKVCENDLLIVTPGIRFEEGAEKDDQKRVLTPRKAIAAGADYIVVGRPIRMAHDPVEIADRISNDIADALLTRL